MKCLRKRYCNTPIRDPAPVVLSQTTAIETPPVCPEPPPTLGQQQLRIRKNQCHNDSDDIGRDSSRSSSTLAAASRLLLKLLLLLSMIVLSLLLLLLLLLRLLSCGTGPTVTATHGEAGVALYFFLAPLVSAAFFSTLLMTPTATV